jgi:hypothetical protein
MGTFATFETVPRKVKARRLFVDEQHMVSGVYRTCPAGMWLVKAEGGKGDLMLMPDDIFREGMRPTDTQSETAWKEQTKKIYPHWPDGKPIPLN